MTPLDVRTVLLTDDPEDSPSPDTERIVALAEDAGVSLFVVSTEVAYPDALSAIVQTAPLVILTVPAAEHLHSLLSSGLIRRMPQRVYLLGSEYDTEDSLLRLAMMIRAGGFGILNDDMTALPFLTDHSLVPTWAEAREAYAALHAENARQAAENDAARRSMLAGGEVHEWTEERELKVKVPTLIVA